MSLRSGNYHKLFYTQKQPQVAYTLVQSCGRGHVDNIAGNVYATLRD